MDFLSLSDLVVLSALLLPALVGAKISADTIGCNNNLRQPGVALMTYSHDFEFYADRNYRDPRISTANAYYWPAYHIAAARIF